MTTFILKDLFIFSKAIENTAPPSLTWRMVKWLKDSSISEYSLSWEKFVDPKESRMIKWDTAITFAKPSDAMLFKLTWYDDIQ